MSMKMHIYVVSPYDDHHHIIEFTKDVSKQDIKYFHSVISEHIDTYIKNFHK